MSMLFRVLLTLALAVSALGAAAQATSNVRGTLDSALQEGGFIVIDGKRLVVRADELVITYNGRMVSDSILQAGLTVFYSTRADGSVSELTLTGPASILGTLDQN